MPWGTVASGLASSWPSCLGRLDLGWQPTVKTGALGHGTRAGAAAVGRIPGEGRRGAVGQWCLGHEGGAADRFEGKWGQETHRTGCCTAVRIGRVGAPMWGATRGLLTWMVD
jgi:hypothetical protein